MIPHQRRDAIVNELQKKKSCTIGHLIELLRVSKVTIHRDLDSLEQKGIIKKVRGGATIAHAPDKDKTRHEYCVELRLATQIIEKKEIAKKAIQLIRDDTSIFIDHSSSGIYLAQELKNQPPKNLILVTNSVIILNELEGYRSIKLVSTGGFLQHDWSALGGQSTMDFLKRLNFDQVFISCGGISIERGIMTSFPFIAEKLNSISELTSEINVLVDNSKFSRVGTFSIMPLTSLSRIITDSRLDQAIAQQYRDKGIEVI